jgi:hypothetical protein
MPRIGRPGLTYREKRELWHRWKTGQTLSEIGRALNQHAGSVLGVLAVTGGNEPRPRKRSSRALYNCMSVKTYLAALVEGSAVDTLPD